MLTSLELVWLSFEQHVTTNLRVIYGSCALHMNGSMVDLTGSNVVNDFEKKLENKGMNYVIKNEEGCKLKKRQTTRTKMISIISNILYKLYLIINIYSIYMKYIFYTNIKNKFFH